MFILFLLDILLLPTSSDKFKHLSTLLILILHIWTLLEVVMNQLFPSTPLHRGLFSVKVLLSISIAFLRRRSIWVDTLQYAVQVFLFDAQGIHQSVIMNFMSESASSQQGEQSPDLQKLHSIWRNIKQTREKVQGKPKLHSLRQSVQEQQFDSFKSKERNQGRQRKEHRKYDQNGNSVGGTQYKVYTREQKNKQSDQSSMREQTNLISQEKKYEEMRDDTPEVRKAIKSEEQKTLKAKLDITNKQLSNARENTALLMRKLVQAEQVIENISQELREQRKQIQNKNQIINRLTKQNKQNQEQKHNFQSFEKSNDKVTEINRRLQAKERQIQRLTLRIRSMEVEKKTHESELQNWKQTVDSYKRKLSDAQKAMSEVYLGEQSKGAQLLELQEANNAIQRLVSLLKSTQQYKKSNLLNEELKQMHFLKQFYKSNKFFNRTCNQVRACTKTIVDERLLWSPTQCYRIMLQMKMKHVQLTQQCIDQSLFELNKIWLLRQESSLKKVKEHYEQEIQYWRKKNQERYDEMVARKQIQRLKKDLSVIKQKNSPVDNIERLKSIGQYQDELRLKNREIKLLQERIKLIETQTGSYERVVYLEGGLWIIAMVIEQIVQQEFGLRDMTNVQDVIETVEQNQKNLIQKLEGIKVSMQNKLGSNKGIMKQSSRL